MMKNRLLIVILLIAVHAGVFAQKGSSIPSEKPKIIVGIVIEQMRFDYLQRFWDKFGKDGFKKLISEGTFCKNAQISYLLTHDAPGIATIYTGANPSAHGIISDEWWVRVKKDRFYCVEDGKQKTIGSESTDGRKSPKRLLSSTITDELKLFTHNNSKVISVSLNDYGAVLPGGHKADACYWYDDRTGRWISSSYYMDSLPNWVKDFNSKLMPEFYLSREWNTLLPIEQYTESLNDTSEYEAGFAKKKNTFPYLLYEPKGKMAVKKSSISYKLLKSTPSGNSITLDFAIAAMINEEMGKDNTTDFMNITFSAPDYVGHRFGPNSVEVQDIFLRLDQNLAHLINFLNTTYGKENVLIFLTSNHGVANIPDYLKDNNIPAGYFKYHYSVALLKSYLNAVYGEGEWVHAYINQQVYLNRRLIEDANLSLTEFQQKVADFLIQYTGVANTVTANTLLTNNFTNGVMSKMQKSFNQSRSGDVMISLQPGWIQDKLDVTDHGSGYDYDTHVPLIWYGWKIKRGTITKRVYLEQIAPTISDFLGVSYPNVCESEPIEDLTK